MRANHGVRTVGVLTVGVLAATGLSAPSALAAAPKWQVAKKFNTGQRDEIGDVLALGRNDLWAVGGGDLKKKGDGDRPTAYHSDGKTWRSVPLPKNLRGNLQQVAGSSKTNVWASGGPNEMSGSGASYLVRWNGKKWTLAKRFTTNYVTGITVLGPKNVWVFGAGSAQQGVGTWHYDGRTWTKVKKLPFTPAQASGVSAGNIWAYGQDAKGGARTIGHFDGNSWKVVKTGSALPPDITPDDNTKPFQRVFLSGVVARSAKDVWVSGYLYKFTSGGTPKQSPLLIHWNGKTWQKVAAPANGAPTSITSDGQGGFWFVNGFPGSRQTLLHRTKAGKWSTHTIAGAGKQLPQVLDLALIPGTRSLLGAGSLRPKSQTSSDGAIYSYKG